MGSWDMQPINRPKLPLQSNEPLKKSKKLIFIFFQKINLAIIIGSLTP